MAGVEGCRGGAKHAEKAAETRPLAVATLEAPLSQNDEGSACDEEMEVGDDEDGVELEGAAEGGEVEPTRTKRGERSWLARRETTRAKRR